MNCEELKSHPEGFVILLNFPSFVFFFFFGYILFLHY